MPIYSYLTCSRAKDTITIYPRKVIIVEGILILTDPDLRSRLVVKMFVDASPDERLMRIIQRDLVERGRSLQQTLEHYQNFVKPMHEQFIEPTKRFADIIVPQGGENHVAIRLLAAQIKERLGLP
ncbi:MAG: Uridine kinase [Bacteroidetes bacterium ADurb.Bin012]|nr:MAG: Uridine kinase [Bacteroidetes bacterium ADurb.Bin012]